MISFTLIWSVIQGDHYQGLQRVEVL